MCVFLWQKGHVGAGYSTVLLAKLCWPSPRVSFVAGLVVQKYQLVRIGPSRNSMGHPAKAGRPLWDGSLEAPALQGSSPRQA